MLVIDIIVLLLDLIDQNFRYFLELSYKIVPFNIPYNINLVWQKEQSVSPYFKCTFVSVFIILILKCCSALPAQPFSG